MNLNLAGKTALVTGASKGIGAATAKLLAAEGCNLVLVSRTAADLESRRQEIAAGASVNIQTVALDLSVGDNVARLAREYPHVDVLVNNAGAIPAGTLTEIDEATWRKAWDLKVFGYINMCRAFYPLLQARGGGVIVNVIGAAAIIKNPNYICGAAGNAGLTAFTQSLGSSSLRDGIRVVGISPGPVATERLLRLGQKMQIANPEEAFRRPATPEEIAAMVAFLASDHSASTSGVVVVVDGGRSARAQGV